MFLRSSSWTFGSVRSRTVDVLGWCLYHSTGLLSYTKESECLSMHNYYVTFFSYTV